MNLKSKEVKRSVRDFESICRDLSNASWENYLSIIRRLMIFISTNQVISKIVDPLFNLQFDHNKYLKDLRNGRSEFIVPADITTHMALTLQLFREFINDPKFSLHSFILHFYSSTHITDNLYEFHNQIVEPALREIITKTEDYIEDEIEGKEEIELATIQVFNIGSIQNENGNIAIGQNINISSINNIDKLPDEFLKIILEKGYSYKDFEKIKNDIEQIKVELKKENPNEDILSKAFEKVKNIGGKIFVEILVKLISNPIITAIASVFI